MAEYNEVIKQFKRMCWYYSRDKVQKSCPMCASYPNCNIGQCRKIAFEQPTYFEDVVMSWAAEHPEPVYPTWGEWLMEQMVIAERMRPKYDYTNGKHTDELERTGEYIAIDSEMKKQIPADIAEKLGIEPKNNI